MELFDAIISDDYFFRLGLSALLSKKVVAKGSFFIDMRTANHAKIRACSSRAEKIFVFISSDLDYYALRNLDNVTVIDRGSEVQDIVSCVLRDESNFERHSRHYISERDDEILTYLHQGLDTHEIVEKLSVSTKAFYSHRARLINKLNIRNRISLYRNISRYKSISQK